ncbi:MAG: nuclear transport factor 2 family protein [Syntrophothermus sp.]
MNRTREILKKWVNSVNSREMETLLSFYDEHAVLIPTFSNRILDTPAKIRDYFERLNSHEELRVSLHENTVKTMQVSEDVYTLSGIYLWKLAIEEEVLSFEARFSFVLNMNSERPIVQHHSSQIPRML